MAILKFLTHAPPSHNSQLVSGRSLGHCSILRHNWRRNLELQLGPEFGVPDLDSIGAQASREGWTPAFAGVTKGKALSKTSSPLGQGGTSGGGWAE